MRKLKDWYVQIEKVNSSPTEYLTYLLDGRRHKGQVIEPLGNVIAMTEALEDDKDWFHSTMIRGGHIPSPAYSLMISFPFKMPKDKWEQLNKIVLSQFYERVLLEAHLEVKHKDDLLRKTVAVIHKENHCHYMLPKILREPKTVLNYSYKRYSYLLKQLVDKTLREEFNISKNNYIVENKRAQLSHSSAKVEKIEKEAKDEAVIIALEVFKPLLAEIEGFITYFKSQGIPTAPLEKKLSTAKAQFKNHNTNRLSKTVKKLQNDITKTTNNNNLSPPI